MYSSIYRTDGASGIHQLWSWVEIHWRLAESPATAYPLHHQCVPDWNSIEHFENVTVYRTLIPMFLAPKYVLGELRTRKNVRRSRGCSIQCLFWEIKAQWEIGVPVISDMHWWCTCGNAIALKFTTVIWLEPAIAVAVVEEFVVRPANALRLLVYRNVSIPSPITWYPIP